MTTATGRAPAATAVPRLTAGTPAPPDQLGGKGASLDRLVQRVTASRAHAAVIWVDPDPWIAPDEPGRDDWGGYADERRRIADTLAAAGLDDLLMVSGDAHMVAADDGANTDYSATGGAGFPLLHAAALDSPATLKGGPYGEGAFPGAGQFGTVTVTDDGGDTVGVELTGRDCRGDVLVSLRVTLPAQD
ncbi:hypothetical protein [Geodermatophilus sp. SYSU D00766]